MDCLKPRYFEFSDTSVSMSTSDLGLPKLIQLKNNNFALKQAENLRCHAKKMQQAAKGKE